MWKILKKLWRIMTQEPDWFDRYEEEAEAKEYE